MHTTPELGHIETWDDETFGLAVRHIHKKLDIENQALLADILGYVGGDLNPANRRSKNKAGRWFDKPYAAIREMVR